MFEYISIRCIFIIKENIIERICFFLKIYFFFVCNMFFLFVESGVKCLEKMVDFLLEMEFYIVRCKVIFNI